MAGREAARADRSHSWLLASVRNQNRNGVAGGGSRNIDSGEGQRREGTGRITGSAAASTAITFLAR